MLQKPNLLPLTIEETSDHRFPRLHPSLKLLPTQARLTLPRQRPEAMGLSGLYEHARRLHQDSTVETSFHRLLPPDHVVPAINEYECLDLSQCPSQMGPPAFQNEENKRMTSTITHDKHIDMHSIIFHYY